MNKKHIFAGLTLVPALSGCLGDLTGSYQSDESDYTLPVAENTAAAIRYEGPLRNPLIVIHGFLGSRLYDVEGDREIWGTFSSRSFTSSYLKALALPMAKDKALTALCGKTRAEAMLDVVNVKAFGINFEFQGYDRLLKILEDSGYACESRALPDGRSYYSMFVFYYDWRYDLATNAKALDSFIAERREYIEKAYKRLYGIENYEVKFDIVAHSMGGMLSRYYLKYGTRDPDENGAAPQQNWGGAKNIDRLIQVGTPNAGYFDTFLELTGGLRLGKSVPSYPPGIIGTFHTYYQMLPNPEYTVLYADFFGGDKIDIFDFRNWVKFNWGLADPAADPALKILLPQVSDAAGRRAIALDHLEKCLRRGRAFASALAVPDGGAVAGEVSQYIFLGESFKTSVGAVIDSSSGKVKEVVYDPGDGKVAVSSASFDTLRSTEDVSPYLRSPIDFASLFFLKDAHMGVTHSTEFAGNVRFLLLRTESPSQKRRNRGLAPRPGDGKP